MELLSLGAVALKKIPTLSGNNEHTYYLSFGKKNKQKNPEMILTIYYFQITTLYFNWY